MRILLIGLNYAPEPVGIGPYTTGLAEALAAAGHTVEIVAALPYYPAWRTADGYRRRRPLRTTENGVRVVRVPIYVPRVPTGARRILHHLSFALSAALPALAAARRRPDLVLTVAPSMMSAPLARAVARLARARAWLHVQDFEIGAAFATGLIDARRPLGRLALAFERLALGGFDVYSSISPQMCARLVAMGMPAARVVEFRNWAEIDRVQVQDAPSPYRAEWGIAAPHVALYSGNLSNKQGLGVVIAAARRLAARTDIRFVICGDGAQRAQLVAEAADLANVEFHDLQPMARLSDLLGLATLHLLPQLAGAADLVLPSKLTNMLASGRPVVATADAGTGLAAEVEGCGMVTPPGDAAALAAAIARIADDPVLAATLGRAARARAQARWAKPVILGGLIDRVAALYRAPVIRQDDFPDHNP